MNPFINCLFLSDDLVRVVIDRSFFDVVRVGGNWHAKALKEEAVAVTISERELLEMALAGYAMKRADIEHEIERVRLLLRLGAAGWSGPFKLNRLERDAAKREKARTPQIRARRAFLGARSRRAKREKARKGGRG